MFPAKVLFEKNHRTRCSTISIPYESGNQFRGESKAFAKRAFGLNFPQPINFPAASHRKLFIRRDVKPTEMEKENSHNRMLRCGCANFHPFKAKYLSLRNLFDREDKYLHRSHSYGAYSKASLISFC